MKKHLFIASAICISTTSFAQGVWNGTPNTVQTTTSAKVGLGVTTPVAKLDIRSSNATGNTDPTALKISNSNSGGTGNIVEVYTGDLTSPPSLASVFAINRLGQVRIGTTAANGSYANYKLSVDGDMIAKRCVIQVTNWADYVFADNYHLPTLNEVEAYVKENNHLPGVPSESEVTSEGLNVGDMNKIMMQKIEELTLYIIDLKKQNDLLNAKVEELAKQN